MSNHPVHDYLTEPEWFSRNLEPETACENLAVWLVVFAIVAFGGWAMMGMPI